jgi:uncharacterized membrane protein
MDTRDWQVRLIQLLTLPGMIIAFYLLLFHEGELVIVCSGGWSDCGAVSGPNAPYSSVGPVPVALIGLAGYAGIFLATWLREWLEIVDDYLPELLVGMIGLALLFSAWLTGLELFIIHAFCRYCLVSAGIIIVMFVLAISYLRAENQGGEAAT